MNTAQILETLGTNPTATQLREAIPALGFAPRADGCGHVLHTKHRNRNIRVTLQETNMSSGRWHVSVYDPDGFGGGLGNGDPANVVYMIRPYLK